MKFVLTVTLSLFCFSVAVAQSPLTQQLNEIPEVYSGTVTPQKNHDRQFVSEWYNYGRTIHDSLSSNTGYFRNYLFPDTTVVVQYSSGFAPVQKLSYGQMCDPASPNLVSNTLIDSGATYSLDSVLLWYRYYRFQNQNPDTLVVQIFEDDRINFFPNPYPLPDPRSYGVVRYNQQLRRGDSASYEYKILLGDPDTATASKRALLVPVGVTVGAGKKIAATVTFLPGNSYASGDTIDPMVPNVVNRINAFAIYDFKDLDTIQNQYFYDNGMLCTASVRYNTDTLGWDSSYIAGNAFPSGYYYLDMAFKLTSSNVGMNELHTHSFSIDLFPSATKENSVLQIQSSNNGNASISLETVTGEKISATKSFIQTGVNKISFPVKNLVAGIYFVMVEMNGEKQVMKFVKL